MNKHSEALKAYFTLADYMKNCYPREEKCKTCLFFMSYSVCLIQRLGLYPELAYREEDLKTLQENLDRLEGDNHA